MGIEAGLKPDEQKELDRIRNKLANGQELGDSEKKRHKELLEKDPEYKARKAQEQADKKAQELEAKQ